MDPIAALATLAGIDALAALPFALAIAAVALWRRRRPLTLARLVEVGLPALLLMMMGIRYALLAPVTLALAPSILGEEAPLALAAWLAAIQAAAAVIGLLAWSRDVAWKLCAALGLLAVALFEAGLNALVFEPSALMRADTAVGVGVATVTVLFAILNWAQRSATPSPLGGAKGPPLDY